LVANPLDIFLDQNHWIYLAKDYWGNPQKQSHKGIAATLLARVRSGEIRLPLSLIHLIEYCRSESPGRRERLATVFEIFSQRWFFAAWADVVPVELSRAIAEVFARRRIPAPPEIIGRGVIFGVGPGGRKVMLNGRSPERIDILSSFAAEPGRLLDLLAFPNELGRLHVKEETIKSCGLDAAAAEQLRQHRKSASKVLQRRAQYVGYTYEYQSQIANELRSLGKTLDDFSLLGQQGLEDFWARVPSLDTDCQLTLYRDRQWPRPVQPNDIPDLGHLALAIPYCNVIVVERFWARAIQETGLAEKYGTVICADLGDLLRVVETLNAARPT
jgi:hypothetical protein